MIRNRTSTILIASALLFAALVVAYGGLYATILAKNREISSVAGELEYALAREQQLRSIKNVVGDTAADRVALTSYLVPPAGTVPLLERIEALGAVAGVDFEITGVAIEPIDAVSTHAAASKYLELLNVTVAAEGTWESLYHVLALVEELPFSVDTKQLQLRKPQQGANPSWSLAATFTVVKQK